MKILLPTTLPGFTEDYAAELAYRAGAIMLKYFQPHGMERKFKSDKSPVTEADKAVNRMVIQTIRADFPSISLKGEEESSLTGSDWEVLIDPIDGTLPYTWGVPIATFMLALLYRGYPVLSVIYDPFQDRRYTAQIGKGAFMNGEELKVSSIADTSARPVVGIASWPDCPYNLLSVAQILEAQGCQIVSFLASGYMDVRVATGEFVATIFPGSTAYDSAPGDLIVQEAGGMATSIFGRSQTYAGKVDGHLFSNGHFHQKICQVIRRVTQ